MVARGVVTFLPSPTSANDSLLRLNANPCAIAKMFCAEVGGCTERFVLKALKDADCKVLKARECMCEICLEFKVLADDLDAFARGLCSRAALANAGITPFTDDLLPKALAEALRFINYRYPQHVAALQQAGQACEGCATHCVRYALSVAEKGGHVDNEDGAQSSSCCEHHTMSCPDCNLIFQVLAALRSALQHQLQIAQVCKIAVLCSCCMFCDLGLHARLAAAFGSVNCLKP